MVQEPIDLDPDTPSHSGQMVPYEVPDETASPTKRARQVITMENGNLVNLIQDTITTSLQGHLGRFETSLASLVQGQADLVQGQTTQASRLTRLETITGDQQQTLNEIQQTHTRRLDHLQAEIVQLQKGAESMSRQASPAGSPSSFRTVGPMEEPNFDLVIGGWKEGLSRESVQTQINSLLDEARLLADVSELKLFGRRPTLGKLLLKFDSGMARPERREKQVRLRDSIRSIFEEHGFWCTMDKPPKLRAISKAVGRLSGFLQQKLGITKDQLIVGSWLMAKCFVGEHLLTGLAGASSAQPPQDPQHLRWLVQDEQCNTRVWADLSLVAAATSRTPEDIIKLWDVHFSAQDGTGSQRP
eukprot:Skav223353  [mRNA]  locus=scaffold200:464164:465237:+ [translate_table: standard]